MVGKTTIRRIFSSSQKACIRAFIRNEEAATAVYFALISPVLIGFSALGAEAALWLLTERKLQHIADVAAYSAVSRRFSTPDQVLVEAAVRNSAREAGLREDLGDTLEVVALAENLYAEIGWPYEVKIEKELPRYLTRLFSQGDEKVLITVRAVAGQLKDSGEEVCMLALSGTASPAFLVSGSGTVTVAECGFSSNSAAENSFEMQGAKVEVIGSCLYTVGGADVTDGLILSDCAEPQSLQRPTPDPYANLSIPDAAVFSGWTRRESTSVIGSFTPEDYLIDPSMTVALFDGLKLNGEVTLGSGLYVIDGGSLKINANTKVTGTGVSFYLMNGAVLDINGGAELDISAFDASNPGLRDDPFAGLLFFSDRTGAPVSHSISGNAGSNINGMIYLPNDNIEYTGNSSSDYACIQIIASTIIVGGNGDLNIGCLPDRPAGAPVLQSVKRVVLLE